MSNDFGYLEYQPGSAPRTSPDEGTSGGRTFGGLAPTASFDFDWNRYSTASRPSIVKPQIWGDNGYFMNGPAIDPFNEAITARNQLLAYTQSWQDPLQAQALDRFTDLLSKYGSTNSAGTLWGLALGNYDIGNDTIQQVLAEDAKSYAQTYREKYPVRSESPASTADVEDPENSFMDNFWQPFEFAARNSFAALSMPMEALQGAVRGIGGELADEDAPWLDFDEGRLTGALAQLGSLVNPLIALAADRVRGDNEFINPWEQTEFGQTLLTAAAGAGFDAFTTMQAGLDVTKAKDEISQLPEYAGLNPAELDAAAVDWAKQRGYYSEPGWFIDETSRVGESQRQATFQAWAIPGPDSQLTAWTLGRGISSAVVGPDSEAYGVMSGFIDAVAAVAGDPTLIAGKFALPSKTVRGVSGLIRGSDNAILIGKEATKARTGYERTIRNLQAAQRIAAEGDTARAEALVTQELATSLKRIPTKNEIKAALSEPIEVNPSELAKMSIGELAEMTRSAEKARSTTERMAAVSVNSDKVRLQMADARRARYEQERLARIATDEADGTFEPPANAKDLWDSYLLRTFKTDENGNRVYDPAGVNDFARARLGYDELSGTWTDIEARTTFDGLVDLYRAWTAGKDEGVRSYDDMKAFSDALGQINTRKVNRPADIAADQVERDMTRLYLSDNVDVEFTALKESGYGGIIVSGIPETGRAVSGSVEGAESLVYWTGKAGPKLVSAGEEIPAALRTAINKRMQAVLSADGMRFADDIGEVDTVAGQVAFKINAAADPRGTLNELFSAEGLTWGRALIALSDYGLEGYLSDFLAKRKGRIDGIVDIDGVKGRTWLGDDNRVVSYATSPVGRQNAESIRTAGDIEDALANLQLQGINLATTGVRGLTVAEIQALAGQNGAKASQLFERMVGYRRNQIVNANRQDEALRDTLKAIDDKYDLDPERAFKSIVGWHAGMRTSATNGITLDETGVRAFLFGNGPASFLGNRALDALSDFIPENVRLKALDMGESSDEYQALLTKSAGQLALATNGKWSGALYKEVADNAIKGGGRTGLIDILSPRLGVDVAAGDIAKTTQVMGGDSKTWFRNFRTPSSVVARALGQIPTPRKVDLSDANQAVEAIMLYGKYADIDEDFLAETIGKVLVHEGRVDSTTTNFNAIADTFTKIGDTLLQRIDDSGAAKKLFSGTNGAARKDAIKNAINSSTRLTLGGEIKIRKDSADRVAEGTDVGKVLDADGGELILPNIQLESELAQGYLSLPSVETWTAAISNFTTAANTLALATNKFKSVAAIKDLATRFFDNVFRTGLLVFRVAYIARNVAEMQVRMFLNGHKSILSDPATMIGMTFGNSVAAKRTAEYRELYRKTAAEVSAQKDGKKATREEIEALIGAQPVTRWEKAFAPYRNTVLDTAFEVGNDEALAMLNGIEDYFNLTRSAHALTDPRVYSSGVRQAWVPVSWQKNSSQFYQGWAYELQMLQRSEISRLVIGGKERQFSDIQAGGDEIADRIRKVQAFLGDDQYAAARANLIAADAKFGEIFASEELTMEYLFSNVNSVYNRIRKLTRGDERLLDFIRTGELKHAKGVERPRSVADAAKRVEGFSSVLRAEYNGDDWGRWFSEQKVSVPWVDTLEKTNGNFLVNQFFQVASKVERLGAVGPEFRLAYWDRVAELAPALRGKDVERARKAATSTLGVLQRMNPDGTLAKIGDTHPAWKALDNAARNDGDGFLTLDDIHGLAMSYAADDVRKLFYDAANRNNFWWNMRLIVPFGQAWGNTIKTWTELGAKKPIQIYKAQKALNSMIESGSSAVYDAGQEMLAYGQYAPGFAPWEQDTNGGFFYNNQYGDTSFMFPFVGRMAMAPMKVWGAFTGVDTPDQLPIESPVASLNLAMGGNSILPGIGPVGAAMINMLPDDVLTEQVGQLSAEVNPFGEKNILEAGVPAWFAKLLGGVGSIPVVGEAAGPFLDVLAESNKNKHLRESFAILSTTGNYPDMMTNPDTARRFQEDALALSKAMLFTTGLIQNFLPATPIPQEAMSLKGDEVQGDLEDQDPTLYTIGMMNSLYQQYLSRNGYDSSDARLEFVKDFGPAALFATTGDWKSLTRTPTSQALRWAQDHPEIARANQDQFPLFFPQGDSSDVAAVAWARKNNFGERRRKNADELYTDIVGFLEQIQRARINSMEANGIISADEASAARDEVNQRYLDTGASTVTFANKTDELQSLKNFVSNYQEIQMSDAGQAFMKAWVVREEALTAAREITGRDNATLGSQEASTIFEWYMAKIDEIAMEHPDFKLLASKFRKEWEQ